MTDSSDDAVKTAPLSPRNTSAATGGLPAALEFSGLSKTFGDNPAASDVGIRIAAGEVVGLVGLNGSGKSTVIKVLAGFHHPDLPLTVSTGLGETQLPYSHSLESHRIGLRFVHQDLGVANDLTAVENMFLMSPLVRGGRLRSREETRRARQLFLELGVDADPHQLAAQLSRAQQAQVAIARAIQDLPEGGVLVLDEPTANLPEEQSRGLRELIQRVAARGIGVLLVSHDLIEVLETSDRVVVMRDGVVHHERASGDLSEGELIRLMIGGDMGSLFPSRTSASGAPLVSARDLHGQTLNGVSVELHAGEVLGVCGKIGSGLNELAEVLAGTRSATGGNVYYADPSALVGYVPPDRQAQGVFSSLPVWTNLTITGLAPFARYTRMRVREEVDEAHRMVRAFGVNPPDPHMSMSQLSGGNQQKVVLAKWLRMPETKVLIVDEGTQGIDVHARRTIYERIGEFVAGGGAVLWCSSDVEETAQLSDRVLVVRDGVTCGVLAGKDLTAHAVLDLMHEAHPMAVK